MLVLGKLLVLTVPPNYILVMARTKLSPHLGLSLSRDGMDMKMPLGWPTHGGNQAANSFPIQIFGLLTPLLLPRWLPAGESTGRMWNKSRWWPQQCDQRPVRFLGANVKKAGVLFARLYGCHFDIFDLSVDTHGSQHGHRRHRIWTQVGKLNCGMFINYGFSMQKSHLLQRKYLFWDAIPGTLDCSCRSYSQSHFKKVMCIGIHRYIYMHLLVLFIHRLLLLALQNH